MNILLYFVNSVINREDSVIVYVFFSSWINNLAYFIVLRHIQTQLLVVLLHLPRVPVSNVCWRLLTFLNYNRQILLQLFNESTILSHCWNSPFTNHCNLKLSTVCDWEYHSIKIYELTQLTSLWHIRSQRNILKNILFRDVNITSFAEIVYFRRTSLKPEGLWRLNISVSHQALLRTNKFLRATVVISDMIIL